MQNKAKLLLYRTSVYDAAIFFTSACDAVGCVLHHCFDARISEISSLQFSNRKYVRMTLFSSIVCNDATLLPFCVANIDDEHEHFIYTNDIEIDDFWN